MQKLSKASSRLTKHMLALLMECHEREILNQEPYLYGTHRSKSLLTRGLLEVKKYVTHSGKEITALFLTESGRKILDAV